MAQAVNCDLYLYADDSCLVYMRNDPKEIENDLNINFNRLCDWFIENIHLNILARIRQNLFFSGQEED